MAVTALVPLTMFGWIPLVLQLFKRLQPHHAAIAGFLLAWMFLPQYEYPIPGLPDYTKISAACYGILLGAYLHDRGAFARVQFHPLDLPIFCWCFSSFISSLTNGLGPWDGISSFLTKVTTWGIPYYVGRLYFGRAIALRDLCIGIFLAALVYVPFCLYEVAMSPRLHKLVYGWHPHKFGQTKRGGGWRPVIFMKHGLMTAMWMISGTLAGCWLLRNKLLGKRLPVFPIASGLAFVIVLVTTILCKSMGAFLLMCAGLAALVATTRMRKLWPVILLAIIPSLYMWSRGSGVWDAGNLLRLTQQATSEERSGSLEFRIQNENILAEKARERLLFGWGGWKRAYVRDEAGETVSVPDGLWIIAFGQNGLFGLSALTLTLLVPQILFMKRYPATRWREPAVAAMAPLSVLLAVFMIDNLLNDMFNPVMLIAAGGLTGLYIQGGRDDDGTGAPAPPPEPTGPRLL